MFKNKLNKKLFNLGIKLEKKTWDIELVWEDKKKKCDINCHILTISYKEADWEKPSL